jgi:hypothetical protein
VEVIAEFLFELVDAQCVHDGGLAGYVLALTPIGKGHRIRMMKGQRALPVFRAFQEGPEGVFVKTRQRGKLFGQVFAMPPGFIQDGF